MTTHQDTSTERERFEAWYFENVNRAELPDWLPTLKTYSSATVANLWCAWQAALASRDEASQQPQGQPITERDDFLQGVCVALQVVTTMDCGVTWREIVEAVGKEAILQFAAHDEPEEWELAGFKRYARTELKCGKPNRQPYVMTSREQAALGRALHKSVRFVDEPQGQAVSDEQIQVAAIKLMEQHPEWVTLINAVPFGSELSPFAVGLVRAILALRDKPAPTLINGLTEAETLASASVSGLVQRVPLSDEQSAETFIRNELLGKIPAALDRAHGITAKEQGNG